MIDTNGNGQPDGPVSDYAANPSTDGGGKWSWAAYLGASWTWCIGMFLPVLLIRDYGPWAWVIFAVPNAVGAAAMGWVMRTRQMSHDYTIRHASACRLFSFVTIAFQLFFSLWMLPRLVGMPGFVGALILIQSAFTPFRSLKWLRIGGAVALGVSIAAAIGLYCQNALVWPGPSAHPITPGDALGLLLVCLAGFTACPYLDLTFHRARQSTNDSEAKVAFGFGFCVLFGSMIVLTFFYATGLIRMEIPEGNFLLLRRVGQALLAAHLVVQMTYTVHVHGAELERQAAARDDTGIMRAGLGLWLAIGTAVGLAAVFGIANGFDFYGRPIGEIGYRLFMSFYGLLFPAYALLAIGRRRVNWFVWLMISAIASPFYWLAFIEGRMTWATGGVVVIVVGGLVGRLFTRPAPAGTT